MDRFQELSKIALDELSEVFARMSDENVRELLEEIKNAKRVFLLGAGREGLSTREFAMRLMHLGNCYKCKIRAEFISSGYIYYYDSTVCNCISDFKLHNGRKKRICSRRR